MCPLKSCGLALIVLVLSKSFARTDEIDRSPERIEALVKKLGDNQFVNRKMASQELMIIGEAALPALKAAAAANKDLDLGIQLRQTTRGIMLSCRKTKAVAMELELIEEGEFLMGSPGGELSRRADEDRHPVRITQAFLLGRYEVTQAEYEKLTRRNPSWFSKEGGGKDKVKAIDTNRFPVERVSWFDAVDYCNRLSKAEDYKPYYKITEVKEEDGWIRDARVTVLGGNGFRLPTEAEWEYACRATTTSPFHYGRASTGVEANVKAVPPTGYAAPPRAPDLNRTAAVGSYKPNRWGLHDMHGNVGEWCWDWYNRDFYDKAPKDDPTGPETGTHRVLRGGNWLVSNGSCRAASRLFHTPNEATYYTGFRVARTP